MKPSSLTSTGAAIADPAGRPAEGGAETKRLTDPAPIDRGKQGDTYAFEESVFCEEKLAVEDKRIL